MRRISSSRSRTALIAAGGLLLLLTSWITVISHGNASFLLPAREGGFNYEAENDAMPTEVWLVSLSLGTLILWFSLQRIGSRSVPGGVAILVGFAILMRIVAAWGEPIHESDFYRYLWDGKSANAGVNPYQFEPGALRIKDGEIEAGSVDPLNGTIWKVRAFSEEEKADLQVLDELRAENPLVYSRVSHPSVPTIYPPLAQVFFSFVTGIFGWSPFGLKMVLIVLDLAVIGLIISLLIHFRLPVIHAALYAWHPLVIKEFANSAHYDVLAILFGLLSLWGAMKIKREVPRALWVGAMVGFGILAKYFIVLLLPILLYAMLPRKSGTVFERLRILLRYKSSWIATVIAGVVVFLGFIPYAIWDGVGWGRLFAGLSDYREHWQYNPGLPALFGFLLDEIGFEKAGVSVSLLVLCVAVFWIATRPLLELRDSAVRCFQILGALFVLSPTAFPWYLCWALAFLAFRPRFSWFWLSLVWPWNYLDFQPDSIAHFSWNGFYLLSSCLWLSFAVIWIFEQRSLRIPLQGR